jgi:restriction endonuclease S subunit
MSALKDSHTSVSIGDLLDRNVISVSTGDEVGKMAYGTGSIPFVRTSDIFNWEIKSIPKQGVSQGIHDRYAEKQDLRAGDILMVKDGSYLIGECCMVQQMDLPLLIQSHILKFRVNNEQELDPYLFFLALNSPITKRQILSMQFTADIIDTIGTRYKEIVLFLPKKSDERSRLSAAVKRELEKRTKSRLLIKQFPKLIEESLVSGTTSNFERFLALTPKEAERELVSDTSALEFGDHTAFSISSDSIKEKIYIPKYYDPSIQEELNTLKRECDLVSIRELESNGYISLTTGDEIGKLAYGTGSIPFVRTTDFANWEIKHNTKQKVSESIYRRYAARENVQENDILLVRDGSYLIGNTCIIAEDDSQMLFCGGLIKIRANENKINSYLLFGLLNSYIVKKQIRSKQFTRDVIDTLGNRVQEIILPIPKHYSVRDRVSSEVEKAVKLRVESRSIIKRLSEEICSLD